MCEKHVKNKIRSGLSFFLAIFGKGTLPKTETKKVMAKSAMHLVFPLRQQFYLYVLFYIFKGQLGTYLEPECLHDEQPVKKIKISCPNA